MRALALESLVLDEIRDIRRVERLVLEALIRLAKDVSAHGLWQTLTPLLAATEHRVKRLELAAVRAHPRSPAPDTRLTARELTVLQLIAEGYANKQIAAELSIKVKTVEKHRQRMMAKLDLHDIASVTRYAISAGVVEASA